MKADFFITKDNFGVLLSAFSRSVSKTHERDNNQKGKYQGFWLANDWCRQSHHPAKVMLKYIALPDTGVVHLHLNDVTGSSGMEYLSIIAYPCNHDERANHRLVLASFSTHLTASVSGAGLKTNALFHREFSTGGSGHHAPFHLIIGTPENEVSINSFYTSYKGHIKNSDKRTLKMSKFLKVVMSDYSGKLQVSGQE